MEGSRQHSPPLLAVLIVASSCGGVVVAVLSRGWLPALAMEACGLAAACLAYLLLGLANSRKLSLASAPVIVVVLLCVLPLSGVAGVVACFIWADFSASRAESYGTVVADEVDRYHRLHGAWPVTLDDLPEEAQARLVAAKSWPFSAPRRPLEATFGAGVVVRYKEGCIAILEYWGPRVWNRETRSFRQIGSLWLQDPVEMRSPTWPSR